METSSRESTNTSYRTAESDELFQDVIQDITTDDDLLEQKLGQVMSSVTENTPLLKGVIGSDGGTSKEDPRSMTIVFPSTSDDRDEVSRWKNLRNHFKTAKPIVLFLLAIVFAIMFAINKEVYNDTKLMCISKFISEDLPVQSDGTGLVTVTLSGPFPADDEEITSPDFIVVGIKNKNGTIIGKQMQNLTIKALANQEYNVTPVEQTMKFRLEGDGPQMLSLDFQSDVTQCVAISFVYYVEPVSQENQVVIAFIILVFVYVLIIFELVHRATAAMFGALLALATLSMLNMRPSLEVILTWIEWDTLSLLFGMMILVAVFSKTGFFDFVALKAYKISRGRVWLLVTILCFATAIISAFLDNVTTILLFTPITIKLCQVLNLDPTYVLIAEVIFSNIGGTATAIGDPPNAIIVSNSQIKKAGIDFAEFTLHISLGIVLCLVLGYGFLRLLYIPIRLQNVYSPVIAELKREAEIWRRTAERVPLFSAEEKTVKLLLMQKTLMLENNIRNMERKA